MTQPPPVTIVSLVAENFKRLRAVEIAPDPDGNLVLIAGRNAQGKSSILDAIWWALAGAKGAVEQPVHVGAEAAGVRIDFGTFIVTKTIKEGSKTAKLTVTSPEGASYPKAQTLLDQMLGKLSFDPLAFANAKSDEQLATLMSVVNLPFTPAQFTAQRKGVYDRRADANREVKRLQGVYDSIPATAGVGDPIDVTALATELTTRAAEEADMATVREAYDRRMEAIRLLEEQIAEARRDAAILLERGRGLSSHLATVESAETLRARLAGAEQHNETARQVVARRQAAEELTAAKEVAANFTYELDKLDQGKADAIAAAQMPVDGLAFDDDGVTYQGVPFSQASGAERLRVSIAMAMALNPNVRVIRVEHGESLDSANLALIEHMARENGFQVWIERVDESGEAGIVIEDGSIVS